MAVGRHGRRGRRLVCPDRRAEGRCARSRGSSRRRRSGRGPPSTTSDEAPGRRDREGARGRPDEPARAGRVRRPRPARFDGMLVGEEVNWGCTGIGTSIGANGLGAGPVIIAGTDEQKATWLPPLIESPILCSFGLSEPEAGSDVARAQDDRRAQGRRVRPERLEDLHHERGLRRLDGRLREDRRRRRATAACPRSSSRWTRRA